MVLGRNRRPGKVGEHSDEAGAVPNERKVWGGDPRKSGPLASEAVGKGSAASSSAKIEVGSGSTASSAKCAVRKKWT